MSRGFLPLSLSSHIVFFLWGGGDSVPLNSYRFLLFFRYVCFPFLFYRGGVGNSVLISFLTGLFRSICYTSVFRCFFFIFRARDPRLQVCIVFAGFTCFFSSEHVFSKQHVYIVFAGVYRNTSSHSGNLYRF